MELELESTEDERGDCNLEIRESYDEAEEEEELLQLNCDVENVDHSSSTPGSMCGAWMCTFCNKSFVKERQLRGHLRQHSHLISKNANGKARRLRRRMQQQARREARRVELEQINGLPFYEASFSSQFVVAQLNESDSIYGPVAIATGPDRTPSSPAPSLPLELHCELDDFEALAVGAVENKFTCPLCPATCYNRSGLGAHMRMHKMSPGSRLTASQIRNVKRRRGRVSCPHCGKDYSRSDQIPRHIRHNCPVTLARRVDTQAPMVPHNKIASKNLFFAVTSSPSSNDKTNLPLKSNGSQPLAPVLPHPSLTLQSSIELAPLFGFNHYVEGQEEMATVTVDQSSTCCDDSELTCSTVETTATAVNSCSATNRRKSRKPMKIVDDSPPLPATPIMNQSCVNLPSPSVGEAPVFLALEEANLHCDLSYDEADDKSFTKFNFEDVNALFALKLLDTVESLPFHVDPMTQVKEIVPTLNASVIQCPSKCSISDDFRLSCETCAKIFKDSRSLGVHKRSAHGIFGARHFRNHRARLTIEELALLKDAAKANNFDTGDLKNGQLQQQQPDGDSNATLTMDSLSDSFACPQCGDILPSKKGLSNHLRTHRVTLEMANDMSLSTLDQQDRLVGVGKTQQQQQQQPRLLTTSCSSGIATRLELPPQPLSSPISETPPVQVLTLRIYNIHDPSRIGSQLHTALTSDVTEFCSQEQPPRTPNKTTAAAASTLMGGLQDTAAEKVFRCDVCDRGFKSAHNLGAHNYQVHGIFGRRLKHKMHLHSASTVQSGSSAILAQRDVAKSEDGDSEHKTAPLTLDLANELDQTEEGEVLTKQFSPLATSLESSTTRAPRGNCVKKNGAVSSHSFACPHCSAVCYTKSGLGAHMRIHRKSPHGELTAAQLSNLRRRKGRVSCPHCSKDYSRSDQIARHIRHNCPAFEGGCGLDNAKPKCTTTTTLMDVVSSSSSIINATSATCRPLLPKRTLTIIPIAASSVTSVVTSVEAASKGAFQCERCSKAFHTAWNLDQHLFQFHRIGRPPDPAEHPNRLSLAERQIAVAAGEEVDAERGQKASMSTCCSSSL